VFLLRLLRFFFCSEREREKRRNRQKAISVVGEREEESIRVAYHFLGRRGKKKKEKGIPGVAGYWDIGCRNDF